MTSMPHRYELTPVNKLPWEVIDAMITKAEETHWCQGSLCKSQTLEDPSGELTNPGYDPNYEDPIPKILRDENGRPVTKLTYCLVGLAIYAIYDVEDLREMDAEGEGVLYDWDEDRDVTKPRFELVDTVINALHEQLPDHMKVPSTKGAAIHFSTSQDTVSARISRLESWNDYDSTTKEMVIDLMKRTREALHNG